MIAAQHRGRDADGVRVVVQPLLRRRVGEFSQVLGHVLAEHSDLVLSHL